MQRAHHFLFAPEPKLLEDNLAMQIAGLPGPDAVKAAMDGLTSRFAELGGPEVAAAFVQQIEHSVCIRSRIVEHRLEQRKGTDLRQLVVLGAGLDTLAYRRPDLLGDLKVFEVDHPDTQKLKREALDRAEIAVPDNVEFSAFDFENQTLSEALEQSGIDGSVPTLFTWLGVHMYLTDDAVKATLAALGKFARGSELVMDFVPEESAELEGAVEDSVTQLRKVVESMGEPMRSRYAPDAIESRLNDAGFTNVTFYSGKRIVDEILGGARDTYAMPDEAVSTLSATILADPRS
jgi:methyltransferase (TIGR00027 family)